MGKLEQEPHDSVSRDGPGADKGASDFASSRPELAFLAGGGRATQLILARDWKSHALGLPQDWPKSLKIALSLILNSPESMILAWGREELTFFFNETYIPLLGPRVAWAMGAPFVQVWADGWEQAKPIIEEAFAGRSRRFVDLPWRLATDRGVQDTWWSFSYSRVLDEHGGIAGLFIFTNETTGRVLADAAARESQQRLVLETERQRLSLQQMPGFVAILAGKQHVFEYVNDAYVAVSGLRDFIGHPVRDVFADLEGQGFYELLDVVYETGQPFRGRAMPLRLAGEESERFVDLLYQPIRGDRGEVRGVFVGGYDVTDAVRAERQREALLLLDARLRDVGDTAHLSFIASELLGQALGATRVGYGTLDAEAGTLVVEKNWSASGIGTLEGVHAFRDYGSYFDDLARGAAVAVADVKADPRTASGVAAFEAIGVAAFMDVAVVEQGRAVAQLFVHSATPRVWKAEEIDLVREFAQRTRTAIARRYAERTLRDYAELLETRVASRTRDLEAAHEQLRQSQKMEAVGQLTGGLAHDFNNLLAGIAGSLEILDRRLAQGRADGAARYISTAQGAVRRAASLTHRLLSFSRQQTLDPKPTDVNRLVTGMDDLIRRTVGPQIVVEVVAAAGLWATMVDRNQLENALLNLCINARDAMPHGGKLIIETANRWLDERAAQEREVPAGQYISLCVSDNGCGMDKDVLAKAFDPFFTTKPIGQGTGLGLSMIYGFARQSGGQVRLYSERDKGTMACLYLPRHQGAAEVDALVGSSSDTSQAGAGETVMVVDDEPTVRMLITDLLGELGYGAIEAADGASALKLLQTEKRVDLLITDVGLPGNINGRQVADAARVSRPNLKVLFITGYAENAVVGHGHLAPGMQVMTKPFSMDELAARIRHCIDSETAPATPVARD